MVYTAGLGKKDRTSQDWPTSKIPKLPNGQSTLGWKNYYDICSCDLYTHFLWQVPNEGSLVLVIALIVLQGVTGISFGLVISAAIDDEQSANQAALGVFYPNLIISGGFLLLMLLSNGHFEQARRLLEGHAGSKLPVMTCSSTFVGIIWPVECIPYPLRYLSLVLPQTYASEALRCIMYRGDLLFQHTAVPLPCVSH